MGLRDEVRKGLTNARELGRDALSAPVDTFNSWSDRRRATRRSDEIDQEMEKAAREALDRGLDGTHQVGEKPSGDPKALHFDPFDLVAVMGYRDRPSGMTYSAMETIGRSVPVVADVIQARTSQVIMFCSIPEDRHSPGFRVRPRDWREGKVPTKAQRKEADRLEQLLLHTGAFDPTKPDDSVSLIDFAKQVIPDSLMYDQMNFEVVPDRKGVPSYITPVDPSTIRLIDPGTRSPGDAFAVQVINSSIVTDFTRDELAFCIRNPRSGIRSYGYGTSELETLIREVTGFLWSIDYNRRFFTQGSATKGVLNFKGTVPDKHLQAFRRQWYAMVAGVTNAWRTPITNAEELQWINLQMSNRDMEYSAWMDFLIKIVCARYQIAPEEVNFSYGNTGQSQAMGQAPIEEKLKASRDLGLRPLVRWFFECLNRHYVQRVNPDFEVVPVGLDAKGYEAEMDLIKKMQESYLTIDEARAMVEREPLGEDAGGNVILNPTWLQWKQGQDGGEGFGDEEGDEDGFPPDDENGEAPELDMLDDNLDDDGGETLKSDHPDRDETVPVRFTINYQSD